MFANTIALLGLFWICNNIFIIIDQCRFSTFGIGPDILMNLLEIVFVWGAWVLFNFYLKQKQRFSVWNFTENSNFISFHGRIFSFTFPKITKTLFIKCWFQRQLQISGGSLLHWIFIIITLQMLKCRKKWSWIKKLQTKCVNSKIFEIPYLEDFFEFLPVVGIMEIWKLRKY